MYISYHVANIHCHISFLMAFHILYHISHHISSYHITYISTNHITFHKYLDWPCQMVHRFQRFQFWCQPFWCVIICDIICDYTIWFDIYDVYYEFCILWYMLYDMLRYITCVYHNSYHIRYQWSKVVCV